MDGIKQVVEQLKKLNQSFERFLRLIDPTLHPERTPFKKVKGLIELDPNKKYLLVFKDDLPVGTIHEIMSDMNEYLGPGIKLFYIGGEFLKEIEVKNELSTTSK